MRGVPVSDRQSPGLSRRERILGAELLSKLFGRCPATYEAYKTNQKYAAIVFKICKLNRLHTVPSVQDMDLFPYELKSSHGCQPAEVCCIM
jgi:hypothetical protein